MSSGRRIAFFGSSLVSAYWNGAATYYRGILKALASCGFEITFYEPDAYERQKHRDIADPPWARVVVYSGTDEHEALRMLEEGAEADILVKASGVGVFDQLLEARVAGYKRSGLTTIFWDVDAPATLERVGNHPDDPFRPLIGRYDLVLTYGGGAPVVRAYEELGAERCVPIYNALDPETHHRAPPDRRFDCDLALLANRLPDREERIDRLFFAAARQAPDKTFLLGGSGWGDKPLPANVRYVGHVYTADHNALNSTARLVLNVSRDSMAKTGWSPATRVFEAAGAAACIITDEWEGIDAFLEPDREVLVARDADDVVRFVGTTSTETAARIGRTAQERVLREHTYLVRAREVEALL
jgi:spore maturation protein CgeB